MSEILFNINNLISPSVEQKLDNCLTLGEKVEILFRLTEFTHYFLPVEADEIKNYWLEKTGEQYEDVYLTEDDKEFIREYLQCFPDLEKVKKLINGLCFSATYDDCLAKAQYEMEQFKSKQIKEALEKSNTLRTNLRFDDDAALSSDKTKKQSLAERLAAARVKANAYNNSRK